MKPVKTKLKMKHHRCKHDYNDNAFCVRCGHSLRNPLKIGWRWKLMTKSLWDLD